jgi:hypothetical protein
MKINHDTPELLVLDYRPFFWAVALIIPTLVFVGISLKLLWDGEVMGGLGALLGSGLWLMALAIFVERLQVILDRVRGTVTLRRRTVLRYRQDVFDLSELSRAEVQRSRGSKGGTTWRPVLVFDRGKDRGVHPITEIYSSGDGAQRTADAINAWLAAAAMERPARP